MHPLVIRSGHCAAFGEHCQAGAELLHSHGSPEWRQVGLVRLVVVIVKISPIKFDIQGTAGIAEAQ